MPIDDTFSEQDQAALAFCIELLRNEPTAEYKEARREARVTRGLSVRRQVWTVARRKSGVGPQDEVVAEDVTGSAPSPAPQPPRDRGPHSHPQQVRERDAADGPRAREGQSFEQRDDAGDSSERHEDRPSRRQERDSSDEEPRWPGGRRPAWAVPKPEPKEATPSPTSMFLTPARNPIEFMVQYLKTTNAEASFEEVRSAAEDAGFTIYPATFGRAQALSGLLDDEVSDEPIRVAPQSSLPATSGASASTSPSSSSAPPRPSQPVPVSVDGIDPVAGMQAFMTAMGKSERDSKALKLRIERMLDVIHRALDA